MTDEDPLAFKMIPHTWKNYVVNKAKAKRKVQFKVIYQNDTLDNSNRMLE